ncbi:ion transporter [Thecamonas trahens ATCC 50062]|uniref:Ion transporter n=1 Tax=Thecamonas trahens ATCC 50062 TaxID=461836 RepID=A0A0L0D222_THETB|nr:ion transporter [Thecamonas trahens ATCC 50062]KNC46165.1 ion transporter [Thecamonas trahens ATCC 50062]|eukprot:XP_013763141.1 ion transporter [Thecamonas trahens ATCC 50062]
MSTDSLDSFNSSVGDAWSAYAKDKAEDAARRRAKARAKERSSKRAGGGVSGGAAGGGGGAGGMGYAGVLSSEGSFSSRGGGGVFGADPLSSDAWSRRSSVASAASAISSAGAESADSMFAGVADRARFFLFASSWRRFCHRIVTSTAFKTVIFAVIILNTLIISLQTSRQVRFATAWYFAMIDSVFLGIYTLELLLKLYVFRLKYFRSGWNWLDAVIVVLSYLEYVQFLVVSFSTINPRIFRLLRIFRAFRALRALRVLRTISFLKHLQIIVSTLLSSIPALGSTVLILGLVLYTFAIIGRSLYGEIYPRRFGTLGRAFFSLFQLITLDDWFEFYDTIKDRDPTVLIFLLVFIVLEAFVLLNLVIAVLVSNLTEASKATSRFYRKKRRARRAAIADAVQGGAAGAAVAAATDPADGDPLAAAAAAAAAGAAAGALAHRTASRHSSHASLLGAADPFPLTDGRDLNAYYPSLAVPLRDKQLMSHFFQLAASLEHNLDVYQSQQRSLDDLVDLGEEVEDEVGL